MLITSRPCYICRANNNPIIASEPVEHRFGRPLMPEGAYNFARCRRCSTLYVDSDVTDEYLSSVYTGETVDSVRVATAGIEHSEIVNLRIPEFQRHWQQIKKYRVIARGDRLIDVGCQTGEFGSIVLQDAVQPNGTELSSSYADTCRSKWGEESQVHCGSLDAAPFELHAFQYATAFETLEHMCDPISTLRRMHDWLAPDGLLALSVPSSDYFHFKFWLMRKSPVARIVSRIFEHRSAFYKSQVLPHPHTYNFSHNLVKLMLRVAGFQPVLVGLTGWHGRIGAVMRPASEILDRVSQSRIGFAPSVFALARPVQR